MATKSTATPLKNFLITGKVSVTTTLELKAADFEQAAVQAKSLDYDDFVEVKGDEFEHSGVDLQSITLDA